MVVGIGVRWQATQAQGPSNLTQAHMKHTPPDRIDRPTYEALEALSYFGRLLASDKAAAIAYCDHDLTLTTSIAKRLGIL